MLYLYPAGLDLESRCNYHDSLKSWLLTGLQVTKMNLTKYTAVLIAVSLFTGVAAAQSASISSQSVTPEEVTAGEEVQNQEFNIVIEDFSADGDTNDVYFEFSDFSEDALSVNQVESSVSVDSSASLLDGNEDGKQNVVYVGLVEDNDSPVTADVTLDIDVQYPEDFQSTTVDAYIEDSSHGDASTTLEVASTDSEETNEENQDENSQETGTSEDTTESTDEQTSEQSTEEATETTEEDEGFLGSIISLFTGLF